MEQSQKEAILLLCKQGQKNEAVKLCKKIIGLGLAEAREIVDNIEKENHKNVNVLFRYKVYPSDILTIEKYKARESTSFLGWLEEQVTDTAMMAALGLFSLGMFWAIFNLIFGGYGWLYCLGLFILCVIIFSLLSTKKENEDKTEEANNQATYLSNELNVILNKSIEIVDNILPYLEMSARKCLSQATADFADNAYYPFWGNIEETCNFLGSYKQAVEQLVLNGELYSKILEGKKHDFPIPFPIGTSFSISQNILDDFNSIVRKAHTKPDFANIFGHIKTQKVMIEGFQNLGQAINNMREEIVSSIEKLEHSIQTEFRELRNIQFEQLKTFEGSQRILNKTLTSMDEKLYFIQYKEKPIRPFLRPLSDH